MQFICLKVTADRFVCSDVTTDRFPVGFLINERYLIASQNTSDQNGVIVKCGAFMYHMSIFCYNLYISMLSTFRI